MEVMLIDDNEIDLIILEKYLEKHAAFKNIQKFKDPFLALKEIATRAPDLVFVDIEMPGMNGLEFAKKIMTCALNIKIIFVTSHDVYALDAFQVYPFDYILKPIQTERLDKTIARYMEQNGLKTVSNTSKDNNLIIKSFGKLEVLKEGKHIKWHGAKTEELFAYLISNYNRRIHKDVIVEALWSNRNYKSALASMQTAIHRVRRSLAEMGDHVQIEFNSNTYILKLKNSEFDLLDFQKSIHEIREINEYTIAKAKDTLELYSAPFLESNGYLWSYSKQADLEKGFIKLLTLTISYLNRDGNYLEAIEFLNTVETQCPTNLVVQNLIKIMKRDYIQVCK